MLLPWNAAALPEIMAGALEESKLDVSVPFHEGRAAGRQLGAAGARGSGMVEARARPNVEVNRRAEGTSELNRRLGAGAKGAAALERCDVAGDYGRSLAGKHARCAGRWADWGAAPPEHAEVEQQKPERGLTLRLTGGPKARPS